MMNIPKAPGLDNTLNLLNDPYRYIGKTCRLLHTDCFQARIFGMPTICLSGAQAAKLFYNPEFTLRKGAAPEPLKATLFGKGAIQSMDGEAHRLRKQVFMTCMTSESIQSLADRFEDELFGFSLRWSHQDKISLYDELQILLTKVICSWTGLPLHGAEIHHRAKDLAAMFDSAAAPGLDHLISRWARKRTEAWIAKMVVSHRAHSFFPPQSPADLFSNLIDEKGELLPARQAAVEIINLLRPTVAISVYLVFVVHALTMNPQWKRKIIQDPRHLDFFVQEVRRYYPFFPSVMAKARTDFEFQNFQIPKGRSLILDLYGTNHDPREWDHPHQFRPERFAHKVVTSYNFIPQGAGNPHHSHRCPGESPTLVLMSRATDFFIRRLSYDVPMQDLKVDYSRLPAIPTSRMILSKIEIKYKEPSGPQPINDFSLNSSRL